jgi:tetratricopeptide (TPR) repeat protein
VANPRIDELRKRLEKEPGSRLFAQLAEELRKDGELDEAVRVCREGLQKQPNYPSARMTLGRALFDSGDLSGARSELESVLKGAPDNILAGRLLGECLERQGDRSGALARFKSTLALAPGDRQIVEHIVALESGASTAAAATIVMAPPSAPAAPPPPPAAVGPMEATLIDIPSAVEAEEAAAPAPVVAEPAPIPLARVESASFELERPYETEPTVVGHMPPAFAGGAAPPPPEVVVLAPEPPPIPLSSADESFELESPYEAPPTRVGAPPPPVASLGTEAAVGPEAAPAAAAPLPAPEPTAAQPPPPPPAAPAAAPAPVAAVEDAELNTVTLAELYLSQGVMDKAMEVYRQVLERDPHNERARTRLSEIEALDRRISAEQALGPAEAGADPQSARRAAIERTITKLEGLLTALRRG